MYATVPMIMPVAVNEAPPGAACWLAAMPKSASSARPPYQKMFSGFTSRCTMPRPCA